jgi:hypothetical protein
MPTARRRGGTPASRQRRDRTGRSRRGSACGLSSRSRSSATRNAQLATGPLLVSVLALAMALSVLCEMHTTHAGHWKTIHMHHINNIKITSPTCPLLFLLTTSCIYIMAKGATWQSIYTHA